LSEVKGIVGSVGSGSLGQGSPVWMPHETDLAKEAKEWFKTAEENS